MWALIDKEYKVIDVVDSDPAGCFHPDIGIVEISNGDDVGIGDTYLNNSFIKENPISHQSREDIESLRLLAYANPVSGSDRYFVEAISLQEEGFSFESDEVRNVKTKGFQRKLEIQQQYPWPVELNND